MDNFLQKVLLECSSDIYIPNDLGYVSRAIEAHSNGEVFDPYLNAEDN